MLLYPSINEIKKKADSRYTLVVMAAKRARDLIDGKPKLTEEDAEKPVSIAAYEINEEKIGYKRGEAAEDEDMATKGMDCVEHIEFGEDYND